MEQYTGNQYDDDLTLGTDEYDDSYYSDADDLFEFSATEESPISRLKSLVLSIDWEITDEILLQFNEELLDLKDIWAGEKINLVYVQALEKISKYIYHNKADSHPNAIKLLLTLYHNLEKIVSSPELTDKERNDILIEDVRRFEGLKKVIGGRVQKKRAAPQAGDGDGKKGLSPAKEELLNLKAVVLGIDWEITDKDLEDLRQEVVYLEHRYAHSKPRLILLQGIGTLGAYIKLKKSDAHADSFKVLHYFYDCLEKMVATPMSLEQEKEILFPAVKEFNAFKAQLGKTVDPEAIARSRRERREEYDGPSGALAPALADVAADERAGFQADEEAREIGEENIVNVDKHVEGFFDESGWGEEGGPDRAVESVLAADEELAEEVKEVIAGAGAVPPEIALQGVDVGEDEEEAPPSMALRPAIREPAPAFEEPAPAFEEPAPAVAEPAAPAVEKFVPGLDVDSEADDDSDEEPLPVAQGDLAPALSMAEDDGEFEEEEEFFAVPEGVEQTEEEILSRVEGFFDDPDQPAASNWKDQDEALEWVSGTKSRPAQEIQPALEEEALQLSEPVEQVPAAVDESLEIEENIEAFFADTFAEPPEEAGEEETEMFGEEEMLEEAEEVDLFAIAEEEAVEEPLSAAEITEAAAEPEEPAEEKMYPAFVKKTYAVPVFKLTRPEARPAWTEPPKPEPAEVAGLEAPAFAEEEEEVVFELVEDDYDIEGQVPGGRREEEVRFEQVTEEEAGALTALDISIGGLGLEIENKDVEGMLGAVAELRNLMTGMPLEQTFLQLLGAVLGQMEKRAPQEGDASFALLSSVYEALQDSRQNKPQANQERLLQETGRVLDWLANVHRGHLK